MGTFVDYPVTCKLCGWRGYESEVRDHFRANHPEEHAKALEAEREAHRRLVEERKKRSWLWRLWYWDQGE